MLKHKIAKYRAGGEQYASSWLELRIFGKIITFSRKVINVADGPELKII